MAKVIDISLNQSSINKAINEIEKYANSLGDKMQKLLRALSDVGLVTASTSFGNVASVTVDMYEDGFILNAFGEAVCFFEFGAGDSAGAGVPVGEYIDVPFAVHEGSWSEQNAKMYSTLGYWEFGGVRYTEIVPKMGMYKASKEMRKQIIDIAKRVFS